MAKSATPIWTLNAEWGVGADPYNWTLFRKSPKRWNAVSFYPNLEKLLESFYQKLSKTEPPQPTLEKHVQSCLEAAVAGTKAFAEQVNTSIAPEVLKLPPRAVTQAHGASR